MNVFSVHWGSLPASCNTNLRCHMERTTAHCWADAALSSLSSNTAQRDLANSPSIKLKMAEDHKEDDAKDRSLQGPHEVLYSITFQLDSFPWLKGKHVWLFFIRHSASVFFIFLLVLFVLVSAATSWSNSPVSQLWSWNQLVAARMLS